MHDYPKVFYALCLLIFLFMHAALSPSGFPTLAAAVGLMISTAALIVKAVHEHRERHRMSAILLFACAVCPALYYLEMYVIQNYLAQGIDPEVLASNLSKAQVVYNLFKFVLLFLAFIVLARNFLKALREFYSNY